jgi:hypothetical protein
VEGLTIAVWRWGSKYSGHYVERLKNALSRHVTQEFRFAVFAPEEEDEYLTKIPGCLCRLRMFDPEWQAKHNLTGRIVSIDLDVVVTGPLDDLFDRPEKFVILHGANSSNPCPYNGSVFMFRAGERPDVWKDFSLKRAGEIPFFQFPDDQAWFAHKMPDAGAWKAGSESGIYAFKKPGWPAGDGLPKDAKMVVFPGWRDPSKFTHLDWIGRHWQ